MSVVLKLFEKCRGIVIVVLAALSANSLPCMPLWLGTQSSFIFGAVLVRRDLIVWGYKLLLLMLLMDFKDESQSEQIINFPLRFWTILITSRIAMVSAERIDEKWGSIPLLRIWVSVVMAKVAVLFCNEPSV